MIVRQLFDAPSSTYTYLVADEQTRAAALIDPVLEQVGRDLKLLEELGIKLSYVLETHVHADHITGASALRGRTGARTVSGSKGAPCADVHVRDGEVVMLGSLELRVLATPGHTDDSVSFVMADRVFTGDALLIRSAGRTDFQNGDPATLYESITRKLFALPEPTLVYPGHDYEGHTVSTIGEERRFNARVAGRSKEEFIALMNGLNLPPPRRIAEAVPINRECGRPPAQAGMAWRNVKPEDLGGLPHGTRRVDVREAHELQGELGRLPDIDHVPLANVGAACEAWPKDAPVLLICRSGARSAQAAELLVSRGFQRVFNLAGGMLAVSALRHVDASARQARA